MPTSRCFFFRNPDNLFFFVVSSTDSEKAGLQRGKRVRMSQIMENRSKPKPSSLILIDHDINAKSAAITETKRFPNSPTLKNCWNIQLSLVFFITSQIVTLMKSSPKDNSPKVNSLKVIGLKVNGPKVNSPKVKVQTPKKKPTWGAWSSSEWRGRRRGGFWSRHGHSPMRTGERHRT